MGADPLLAQYIANRRMFSNVPQGLVEQRYAGLFAVPGGGARGVGKGNQIKGQV